MVRKGSFEETVESDGVGSGIDFSRRVEEILKSVVARSVCYEGEEYED